MHILISQLIYMHESVVVLPVQELVKRAAEYGSSMDAMQLSLDEIRRQCTDKDAKLDQFRMMLEQYEKQEVFSHVH